MLDKLKEKLGSGEDQTYEYDCTSCGERFESPHVKMNKVRCPECHSANAIMADRS